MSSRWRRRHDVSQHRSSMLVMMSQMSMIEIQSCVGRFVENADSVKTCKEFVLC